MCDLKLTFMCIINGFRYFYFIGAFSFLKTISVTWLTAQEVQHSTVVYEVTLNTNTADCVCELIDKAPVYILLPSEVLPGVLFLFVSIELKTLIMIAILRARQF